MNENRPEDNAGAEPPPDLKEVDGSAANRFEVDSCPPLTEAVATTSGCGSKVSESLSCPVCFRRVETNDLNVFNRHIDHCLSDASENPGKCSDSDPEWDLDQENQHSECGPTRVSDTTDVYHKEDPPTLKDAFHTSALFINDTDRISQNLQTSVSEGHVLICPICQLSQNNDDLVMFNQHVDLCLNQETLSRLEGETHSVTSSRSFGKCVCLLVQFSLKMAFV